MNTADQTIMPDLRAPFPWFGGKRRVAHLVWERFANVVNYIEPFFGSGAVLLERPTVAGSETVNDLDCYLANFWRALAASPDELAAVCDWPVNECDLLARHTWLLAQTGFRDQMRTDPEFYDVKIAAWWVWGLCCWIGSGWCVQRGDGNPPEQIPHLGDAGRALRAYFAELSERLRGVRVACGDWGRVLGDSVTIKHGLTGVFLDPPYDDEEHSVTYSAETVKTAQNVRQWAILNGDNPLLRIALCGYEGEHVMPDSWECVAWKARGGYGSQSDGAGRENSSRERIWFSPACLRPDLDLFR